MKTIAQMCHVILIGQSRDPNIHWAPNISKTVRNKGSVPMDNH